MARKRTKIIVAAISVVFIALTAYYLVTIGKINSSYAHLYGGRTSVALRKFPFPYQAALTISSDIDKTSSVEEFLEIQEFLNTKHATRMGEGLGLEIGNSFFMFTPGGQEFSYLSGRPIDKIIIGKFIKSGYVDTIHSWGGGYEGRSDAIKAIEELNNNHLKLEVWINHATAKSNLGRWFPKTSLGDNKGSQFYHSDITVPYGIKFVWLGASTWIIGQATPIKPMTFLGSFDSKHFLKSVLNVSKESAKHIMSVFGISSYKYAMHASNDLVMPVSLDDGRKVYQFMRYDNHFDGIGAGATSKTMAYNLTERVFRQLLRVKGYAILYTHLGKNADCLQVIDEGTQKSLRLLAQEYHSGRIYVTTQAKLLRYYLNQKYLKWNYAIIGDEVRIEIDNVDDPVFGVSVPSAEDLQGITFYFPSGKKPRVLIGSREIPGVILNPLDESGRASVTIPFIPLIYPDLDEEKAALHDQIH